MALIELDRGLPPWRTRIKNTTLLGILIGGMMVGGCTPDGQFDQESFFSGFSTLKLGQDQPAHLVSWKGEETVTIYMTEPPETDDYYIIAWDSTLEDTILTQIPCWTGGYRPAEPPYACSLWMPVDPNSNALPIIKAVITEKKHLSPLPDTERTLIVGWNPDVWKLVTE